MITGIAIVLLWVVALAQGALLLLLYRQVGTALLRRAEAIGRDGPPVRKRFPDHLLALLKKESGGSFSDIGEPRKGLVLVFARPSCGICLTLWPELREFMLRRPDLAFLIVFSSDAATATSYARDHRIACPVVPDPRERIFGSLRVRVTPFAIVTDSNFNVETKGIVNNTQHLVGLTDFTRERPQADATSLRVEGRGINAVQLAR